MAAKKKNYSQELTSVIVEGILKKKGQDVVTMNLMSLPNSVSDFFVICHGTSKTQIEAIAQSVLTEVKNAEGGNPWHKEGFENAEWILLDYVNVVVHIFMEETRRFYNLESLWADAEIQKFKDTD